MRRVCLGSSQDHGRITGRLKNLIPIEESQAGCRITGRLKNHRPVEESQAPVAHLPESVSGHAPGI